VPLLAAELVRLQRRWLSVDKEHCALCARMWRSEREAFRANLDTLPVNEPICDACLMAFWQNLGLPISENDTTEH